MDSPSFEHQPLEADLKTIATEVNYTQEQQGQEAARLEGVEAVKNAIRAFPTLNDKERVANVSAGVQSTPAAAPDAANPLPAYADAAAPEVKREIEHLLDIAMEKGIGEALTESEKSPYFVQDAFHDALAGKLYPELQQRGLIK